MSNIPGPTAPLYMRGCPLKAIYPVVPLADNHAVSVGMTTVHDQACFGIYADRHALPDADWLARDIDHAITELLEGINDTTCSSQPRVPPEPASTSPNLNGSTAGPATDVGVPLTCP